MERQMRQSSDVPPSTGSSLSTKSKTHEPSNTLTPLINGDMVNISIVITTYYYNTTTAYYY